MIQKKINNDNDLVEYLKKIAQKSDIKCKHAAALICGNTIYATDCNKFSIDCRTIHAEINVTLPYKNYLSGMDIIVIRINDKCVLRNSRPCNECINKLEKLGIRRIYYSNQDGIIISELVKDMPRLHISSGTRYRQRLKIEFETR